MNHLETLWNETQAADEFTPVPGGEYRCRLVAGQLGKSQKGTPGFRVAFEIIAGEHAGRKIWHSVWLTEAAMPLAKRDLPKLGITAISQLAEPIRQGLLFDVRVALRTSDDGIEFNVVRAFSPAGEETLDPFTPEDACTVSA